MIADRLSRLRIQKKKTQQDMADAIGISRPAYTAYESGNRKPDYEILNKIVDILDTNSDYLLGRTNNSAPIPTQPSDETGVYMAYLGGPPEEMDEEEAEHIKRELEMFRAFKEKRRRERGEK